MNDGCDVGGVVGWSWMVRVARDGGRRVGEERGDGIGGDGKLVVVVVDCGR